MIIPRSKLIRAMTAIKIYVSFILNDSSGLWDCKFCKTKVLHIKGIANRIKKQKQKKIVYFLLLLIGQRIHF